MSFSLLSHILASLCPYISSKAMYSYIPNPCGTPSVLCKLLSSDVTSSDIISKWLISMWCQQGKEYRNPRRYAMIKRLQVISTSGNVTRTHLSYLLSFKLPPCMICSKLPCFTSLSLCTCFSHYLFVHTLRGSLVCIMLVS
jgi:hypothetical protein